MWVNNCNLDFIEVGCVIFFIIFNVKLLCECLSFVLKVGRFLINMVMVFGIFIGMIFSGLNFIIFCNGIFIFSMCVVSVIFMFIILLWSVLF